MSIGIYAAVLQALGLLEGLGKIAEAAGDQGQDFCGFVNPPRWDRTRQRAACAFSGNPARRSTSISIARCWPAASRPVPAKVNPSRTTTPSLDILPTGFGFVNTPYNCTLDVRVNAPEASRNKSLRVWSGRCIGMPDVPN
ncbi:MAG: hypothetical protein WDO68_16965 [Gammaproteobacteria bacterium]